MQVKEFTLEYWEDDDWYVGRLVEIPGVFSQGETLDELKKNIQDGGLMLHLQNEKTLLLTKIKLRSLITRKS